MILAIDYGKKRLGLALSDELGITARPFGIWTRVNRRRDLARLHELVRQEAVRRIVVGLPLHLDGTPSEMSEEAKSFSARLEKAIGIPVALVDERLSSAEAAQNLSGAGVKARGQKAMIDAVAAQVILQSYFDQLSNPKQVVFK